MLAQCIDLRRARLECFHWTSDGNVTTVTAGDGPSMMAVHDDSLVATRPTKTVSARPRRRRWRVSGWSRWAASA